MTTHGLWGHVAQVRLPVDEAHPLPFGIREGLHVCLLKAPEQCDRLRINRCCHKHLVRTGWIPSVLDVERYGPAVWNLPAKSPLKLPSKERGEADDHGSWILRWVRQVPQRLGKAFLRILAHQEEWRLVVDADHR
eukprot:CAMPEP_0171251796 /NCGR_PEP_ID=MMETSP0790-20130122/50825_1 /TAXON_ID=2925 /ORGANISM="Alexandrium catenella, Strain OF101" /LENGTH=134 /DNA_ID=CAMNT_0011719507 /DNA_START=187 /DNA_END=587 /DNA_ORIENTATION=-